MQSQDDGSRPVVCTDMVDEAVSDVPAEVSTMAQIARRMVDVVRRWWGRGIGAIKSFFKDSWNQYMGYYDADGRFGASSAALASVGHGHIWPRQACQTGIFEPGYIRFH